MRLLLALFGRLLAAAPEFLPRALCALFGDLIWFGAGKRRRMMLANLHHAFPDKGEARRRAIGRASCRRTVEMALFALASPYFSEQRIRAIVTLDDSVRDPEVGLLRPGPAVLVIPHFALMEAITLVPVVMPEARDFEVGVFFRPLDNPKVDAAVKASRERFGLRLLSRKEGFKDAMGILRRGGRVAVLFDQNAGSPGSLSLFLGRAASTSELAGMLAEKFDARVIAFPGERSGFWRCVIRAEKLAEHTDAANAASLSNRWLERRLASGDDACAQWLWLHNRWKTRNTPGTRLRLDARRDITATDFATLGLDGWPASGDRFVIRMPNWLGDVVMALPLVRAIRAARPDAHVTLLAKKPFAPLLESLGVAQRVIALPGKDEPYRSFFLGLRTEYPDTHFLFTNSFRGDLEARRMGAPQRFGMVRPGKWRPLLTRGWKLPASLDETREHQTRVWEKWLREAHGLDAPLNLAPFRPVSIAGEGPVANRVGVVCGTENFPAKRWPVTRWRELVAKLLAGRPGAEIRLFGTANDLPVTEAVAAGFDPARVLNLAGKTGLLDYCRELTRCAVIACNDTGGMHLANMLGVPVVAVFGPTNPVRTGPVFDARAVVLQPPGCPAGGGADIAGVTAERVTAEVLARL